MDVPHQQFHVTKFTTWWYLDKSFCIYGWLIKSREEDLSTRDDGVITYWRGLKHKCNLLLVL